MSDTSREAPSPETLAQLEHGHDFAVLALLAEMVARVTGSSPEHRHTAERLLQDVTETIEGTTLTTTERTGALAAVRSVFALAGLGHLLPDQAIARRGDDAT